MKAKTHKPKHPERKVAYIPEAVKEQIKERLKSEVNTKPIINGVTDVLKIVSSNRKNQFKKGKKK